MLSTTRLPQFSPRGKELLEQVGQLTVKVQTDGYIYCSAQKHKKSIRVKPHLLQQFSQGQHFQGVIQMAVLEK